MGKCSQVEIYAVGQKDGSWAAGAMAAVLDSKNVVQMETFRDFTRTQAEIEYMAVVFALRVAHLRYRLTVFDKIIVKTGNQNLVNQFNGHAPSSNKNLHDSLSSILSEMGKFREMGVKVELECVAKELPIMVRLTQMAKEALCQSVTAQAIS